MKFQVVPNLRVNSDQEVSGSVKATYDHEGATWSVTLTDSVARGGKVQDGMRVGVKSDAFELSYNIGDDSSAVRFDTSVAVRDKSVALKYTHTLAAEQRTHLDASCDVDDNNTARCILECKAGQRPSHKDLTLGWVHRRDDFEFEPRFNLGTESLSAAVTYKVDDENKLRAIFDTNTNEGSLRWTNTGSLGGGGELRVTATATLDKNGMKQMPSLLVEKHFDVDF